MQKIGPQLRETIFQSDINTLDKFAWLWEEH